ncbi:class I SAM-dependent methyltransferase [Flavobacterium sp.]|uniref:class I SAM-dependent methyltransferase n=1 Tax=Flavobacterium sp. TaxID=239 RepID=UPI002B4B07F3|nr:class I SAM-dependent methyltransferase [Flavobacterium sp.]HLP65522.1 class I SAM-dependent methyltransferase [Flavobacterium sp.]
MKDLFGRAILDYQTNNEPQDLITETNISEADEMSVAYLFRSFKEMPKLEQKALQLSKGKILDVGCGAGSHSLYLQEKGFDVTSIDVSENAIQACQLRGLKNARVQNLLDIHNETFDTILLLMNGTGIFGTLAQTSIYLQKLKSLLNPNGQILIDSSDIIYIFDEEEDGSKWIPADGYYGELTFTVSYKNQTEKPFPWLYLDYNTLQNAAHANGLNCKLITEGKHFDYLAQLSLL